MTPRARHVARRDRRRRGDRGSHVVTVRSAWQSRRMKIETVTGYCWPQSVAPGTPVGLHLSSAGGRPVEVEIARVGAERTVVWTGTMDAGDHPTPHDADSTAATGLPPPRHRRRRLGFGLLRGAAHDRRRRQDPSEPRLLRRPTDRRSTNTILLQLATNTWHAYNDFAGRNLYNGEPTRHSSVQWPAGTSTNRRRRTPSDNDPPARPRHEHPRRLPALQPPVAVGRVGRLARLGEPIPAWAERNGYGIDVISNADLEEHPTIVERYNLLLSVGHDEYWSGPMRDTVEDFIGAAATSPSSPATPRCGRFAWRSRSTARRR